MDCNFFFSDIKVKSYLEWNVGILCKEHLQLAHTDPEVPVSEFIRDVETKGTKLPSLNHNSVEECNSQQQVLELVNLNRLRRIIKFLEMVED